MKYFVHPNSIVREIWGKADTILFIFAGAAAEFSLNKAVDWLYFTGRLPADPIGRLFSTVSYAKQIIFSEEKAAHAAIDKMNVIHAAVEGNRNARIPDWAYRDVLFMLIHYSITSFELLERKLSQKEKNEIVEVFYNVGIRMNIQGLPSGYTAWVKMHELQLSQNLIKSDYTVDLYKQYRKHLGYWRYKILLSIQSNMLPRQALKLLSLSTSKSLPAMITAYKLTRRIRLDSLMKSVLLPSKYISRIKDLDLKKHS